MQLATTVTEPVDYMKATKIIIIITIKVTFTTLYIRANAKYADDKQTQNVTAEIKIKRRTNFSKYPISWYNYGKSIDNSNSVSYYEK
jgi:hypothetical protein